MEEKDFEVKIYHIVCCDKEGNIGIEKDGRFQMPWNIPEDLKHFKEITSDNIVIMGGNTWKSINKILPNRINIIVSKTLDRVERENQLYVIDDLNKALDLATELGTKLNKHIFIIGGSSIYEQTLENIDGVYITLLEENFTHRPIKDSYNNYRTYISMPYRFIKYPLENLVDFKVKSKDPLKTHQLFRVQTILMVKEDE